MYSGVATGIFAVRNAGKTAEENIGRLPVTVGQGAAVIKAGSQYNNAVSKQAKVVINTFEDIAKTDKLFGGLTKAVKFASDNVNPLIVASSVIKVGLADKDERKNTLIAETGCVAGMFLGEGWMKKNLDKILTKLPVNKKWIPIIKGVTFVAGSITASTIGQNIGKKTAQYWDTPLGKEARAAKETQPDKESKPLNYKA